MAIPAILWDKAPDGALRCGLCSRHCLIPEGCAGFCRARVNRKGVLWSLVSDRIVSANLDPVEKKPLFHFLPGTGIFSVGTQGCTMTCSFCQNHGLSQGSLAASSFRPGLPGGYGADIARAAVKTGAAGIAYTYNEPTVAVEMVHAAAPAAIDAGLANVLISNAYQSPACLNLLRDMIHAANFDLKSFRDEFYRNFCSARLKPVLRTIETAVSFGWWVELTTLLIPGRNDSDAELRDIARFIKENLGPQVPWHISRFHPMFRMRDVPATPVADLERAHAIGLAEGLLFVYTGNVPGHEHENTRCPNCKTIYIRRRGYRIDAPPAAGTGRCAECGTAIPGVWSFHLHPKEDTP